ncbi:MAG: DUF3536 domain-containing protein [Anaerolineales bacterium]|nr:DUF3536 domain-containing protein [Anaerolineales bacterium]
MTLRSLCIHGHFYQPPREDPLTSLIPQEAGCAPYPNWNERIHSECYRPNAELGNFERISFNIGPTLCTWMVTHDPEACRLIVAQDRANLKRYGVGNAIGQAYNHTILPLASRQDKVTQVAWGIADFEHHFGRKPEGMWLPETAADLETLSVLAEQGIRFTILAPWQARCDQLDPTEPYRVTLPDGSDITVFFYHRELSTGISFNPVWTTNADGFVRSELLASFNPEKYQNNEPQMVLIASDGELYGHHQPFRDRFLAHLVNGASTGVGLGYTFPALWLRENANWMFPRRSVEIMDKTSWSCHHGVLRWMGECACTPGDGRWKAYLRQTFNHLADSLDELYLGALRGLAVDPWQLRNRYIYVIQGRISLRDLLAELAGKFVEGDQFERIRLLLMAQWERQRMFTSCGWFFDDFSRIEPRNNVAYAAQAVRLARLATGVDLAPRVREDLKRVISHQSGLRGDMVFERHLSRAEQLATSTNPI